MAWWWQGGLGQHRQRWTAVCRCVEWGGWVSEFVGVLAGTRSIPIHEGLSRCDTYPCGARGGGAGTGGETPYVHVGGRAGHGVSDEGHLSKGAHGFCCLVVMSSGVAACCSVLALGVVPAARKETKAQEEGLGLDWLCVVGVESVSVWGWDGRGVWVCECV